jgi:ABC-type phosphate/phosphonate transport system ATPase subunit
MSQDEMPEQPKTAKIAAANPLEIAIIELTRSVRSGIAELRVDIGLVSNDLGIVKQRVSIIESLRVEDEARALKLSGGVRGLSQHDAEQSTQLAQEKAAREALATKVDELSASQDVQLAILGRLDKLAANPTVKVLLFALGTIATGYLASKGLAK